LALLSHFEPEHPFVRRHPLLEYPAFTEWRDGLVRAYEAGENGRRSITRTPIEEVARRMHDHRMAAQYKKKAEEAEARVLELESQVVVLQKELSDLKRERQQDNRPAEDGDGGTRVARPQLDLNAPAAVQPNVSVLSFWLLCCLMLVHMRPVIFFFISLT
jgi:hypothetical protein